MSHDAFWGDVRATIRREIIRLAKGTENVDNVYTITPIGEKMIEDLVQAFQDGQKVPGLSDKSDNVGLCTMNWPALACFTRYYAGTGINGEQRDYIRQQLAAGVSANDLTKDELLGTNWYECTGNEPEDEKNLCCPKEVLDDWYYQDLSKGVVPEKKTDGYSWLTIGLLGLGVFAVAVSLRALASVHPNPSSSPLALRRSRTSAEAASMLRAQLRTMIAKRHSFEVWDEARDYLTGAELDAPPYVFDAVTDLQRLVKDLNAGGKSTDEIKELDLMLDLSAGAA